MRKRLTRLSAIVMVGGAVAVGCQSGSGNKGYPPGPLLASKPHVDGQATSAPPVTVADAEPQAPPLPTTALASMPAGREPAATLGLPNGSVRPSEPFMPLCPAVDSNRFRTAQGKQGVAPGIPAVRSSGSSPAIAEPALIAQPADGHQGRGTYGHDPAYAWLQGVVEKHYQGHVYLRFCDPSTEDRLGGKVCLHDNPTLAQFKDGDVIHVEGTVDPEPDRTRTEAWNRNPRYHVRTAWLVERKQ
jgi:hypothetical protein